MAGRCAYVGSWDTDALLAMQGLDMEEGADKVHPVRAGQFPHISTGPEAGEAMPAQG